MARRAAPAPQAVPVIEEEVAEPTRPVAVADRARSVEELSEHIAREAEALLTGTSSAEADDRLADLHLRLALFHWDVLEDGDGSLRHVEQASRHPLAAALLLGHALGGGKPELLDGAQSVLERQLADGAGDPRRTAAMLAETVEAWLYRFGDPHRAAEASRTATDLA
ncbi:MAG TPA: hypothetical protein VL172_19545, partial [Kofleriaceae bacterium]|nr:hypothetical protein [Kofleriaceae bacterium]